jgi:hypothetical protein
MTHLGAVPYSKQSNEFLIGVINKVTPELKSLAAKLANKSLTSSQRAPLLARQKKVLTGYWNPAVKYLRERGYNVSVSGGKVNITPPKKVAIPSAPPASRSTPEPIPSGKKTNLILMAVAAAGLYWYFVMRKKAPELSSFQSA